MLSSTELRNFFESLDEEREYFNVNLERVLQSNWVIPEYVNGELAGVAGVERKYGIMRSWTIVKKDYWRQGVASRLGIKRLERCRKERLCHALLAIIEKKNLAGIKNAAKIGYKIIGKNGNLYYLMRPVTKFGNVMAYAAIIAFPFFLVLDKFRK
jgi:RimJ/RimL family protein N-acetyltransferase